MIVFLLLTCLAIPSPAQDKAYWNKMADGMSRALVEHFWGANFEGYEDRYYFNYGSDLSNMTTNHYWPQAHAMDVLVDAYMRTGDDLYRNIFPLWWEGMPRFNFANVEDRCLKIQERLLQRTGGTDCGPSVPLLHGGRFLRRQGPGSVPERGGQNLYVGEDPSVQYGNGCGL